MPVPCTPLTVTGGHIKWSGKRDKDGYREYKVTYRVAVDDTPTAAQGPASVLQTPGLGIPGITTWNVDGDVDVFAVCQRDADVRPVYDGERCAFFDIEQIYTNKPDPRCFSTVGTGTGTGNWTDDPLTMPPRISGGFIKSTIQAEFDKDGDPIVNPAFEKITGPNVEFDVSRATVIIEMNFSTLGLQVLMESINTVNELELWGFPPRTIKLSDIQWQQLYYSDCSCYFNIRYEFEIADPNGLGWDREIISEGTKALAGRYVVANDTVTWVLGTEKIPNPDPTNPHHFVRIRDIYDNPVSSLLNIFGLPVDSLEDAYLIPIEFYNDLDFVTFLGIPEDLECPV